MRSRSHGRYIVLFLVGKKISLTVPLSVQCQCLRRDCVLLESMIQICSCKVNSIMSWLMGFVHHFRGDHCSGSQSDERHQTSEKRILHEQFPNPQKKVYCVSMSWLSWVKFVILFEQFIVLIDNSKPNQLYNFIVMHGHVNVQIFTKPAKLKYSIRNFFFFFEG